MKNSKSETTSTDELLIAISKQGIYSLEKKKEHIYATLRNKLGLKEDTDEEICLFDFVHNVGPEEHSYSEYSEKINKAKKEK